MRGQLITLEGVDGVGKSCQVQDLGLYLGQLGIPVMTSREPGNVFEGELRRLLMHGEPVPLASLFLFLADRAQHVETVVKPALAEGTWVILDRFVDSTVAYQWWADYQEHVPATAIHRLFRNKPVEFMEFVMGAAGIDPDLTLVLTADPTTVRARLAARAGEVTRFDTWDEARKERLRTYFEETMRFTAPNRARWVDAGGTRLQTQHRILEALRERWPRQFPGWPTTA